MSASSGAPYFVGGADGDLQRDTCDGLPFPRVLHFDVKPVQAWAFEGYCIEAPALVLAVGVRVGEVDAELNFANRPPVGGKEPYARLGSRGLVELISAPEAYHLDSKRDEHAVRPFRDRYPPHVNVFDWIE